MLFNAAQKMRFSEFSVEFPTFIKEFFLKKILLEPFKSFSFTFGAKLTDSKLYTYVFLLVRKSYDNIKY